MYVYIVCMNIYISICICTYTLASASLNIIIIDIIVIIAFILIVTICAIVIIYWYILYHVSYLHIRGQISGNSLERTSTLPIRIGTKSVKSQRLQAFSASMKAAFLPRIPVPWLAVKVAPPAWCRLPHLPLRTQLSISLKASMENCQARSCSKWTTRNADRHWTVLHEFKT